MIGVWGTTTMAVFHGTEGQDTIDGTGEADTILGGGGSATREPMGSKAA